MDVVQDEPAAVFDEEQADGLRARLVDGLLSGGWIRTAEVEAAFRAVPRHLFAPEATVETAYADDVVRTKFDADGAAISSVSADLADQVRTWDRDHRDGPDPRVTTHPLGTPDHDLPPGRTLDRAHARITITWPHPADPDATCHDSRPAPS